MSQIKRKIKIVFEDEEEKYKGTIHLGLCCIVDELRKCKVNGKKTEIFSGRTINSRKNFTVEKAIQKATQNCKDLLTMLKYCKENNIKCFRVGSDIFPRYDDPEVESYDLDFAKEYLKAAGDYAKKEGIRLLQHPCQLVNIASPKETVWESSVKILEHHADILDMMGMNDNSILIIHGGGVYTDKEKTIETWITRFYLLPQRVKDRLVIENCERHYSIEDCLYISSKTGIPVVYDTHHKECYDKLHPQEKCSEDFLSRVMKTWGNRTPIVHVSNQKEGTKIGAHSDYITVFPQHLLNFIKDNKTVIHLEVEAKAKEKAIFALRKEYPCLQ